MPTSEVPLTVALLRGIPEYVGSSVRQFADALQEGFSSSDEIKLTPVQITELGVARRLFSTGRLSVSARGAGNVFDSFVRYPLAVRRWGRERPPALYHVIDVWYGHLARHLPAEQTIVSCQDVIMAKYPELPTAYQLPRRDRLRFRISTEHLDRAARVVCSSSATRADLISMYGVAPQRIRVVPKGVSPRMRPASAGRPGEELPRRPLARRTVLHVSTGWPYKNVPATLRVLAELRARGMDVGLVRTGARLSASERALAEDLHVTDHITDRGWVTDDELVALYQTADVLLFPSLYEGFGRPPAEAMACGTPVVCSNAPALLELTGDAGLHAAPDDVGGLADGVERVLGDHNLAARMRARGLQRAKRYSWAAAVSAYREIYREVGAEAGLLR